MLNERDGCKILKALFEARGYSIVEDFPFREGDVSFSADGWDPTARVGYEFMTLESRDHEDLSPDELVRLSEWTEQGKLFLFVVDETDVEGQEELSAAAEAFLDEVDTRRRAQAGR